MSTNNIKSKTLEFIEYLRSTDEYGKVLERFKEYLKTAQWDRTYVIVYRLDDMDYEFGEVFHVCNRTDSLIILAYGHYWDRKITINLEKYD